MTHLARRDQPNSMRETSKKHTFNQVREELKKLGSSPDENSFEVAESERQESCTKK